MDPGKSKETATGFGNSPSRNKGGDGFSPTTSEQKWHKTKDLLNFVLFDGKNAFREKKQAKCCHRKLIFLLGTPFWKILIDSTGVPFLGGVHNVCYVPGRHYLLGDPEVKTLQTRGKDPHQIHDRTPTHSSSLPRGHTSHLPP